MKVAPPGKDVNARHYGRDPEYGGKSHGFAQEYHRKARHQHGADTAGDGIDQGQVTPFVAAAQQCEIEDMQEDGGQHEPPASTLDGVEPEQNSPQRHQQQAGRRQQAPHEDLFVAGALQQKIPGGMGHGSQQNEAKGEARHGGEYNIG